MIETPIYHGSRVSLRFSRLSLFLRSSLNISGGVSVMILKLCLAVGCLLLFECSEAAEKGEKLVAEIDQIGEEYVVVQDDFKINDELDLRENLTTVVAAVVSTTEKTTDKEVEGGGDEHEESDPEEPRPHNDNEFGEFGDSKASHVEEPSEAPPLNFADHHIEIPSNSEHSESEDPAKNEEISETPPPKDPVENRQKIENNESHVAEVPPTKYMAEDLSKIQKIESHVDSDPLKFVAATAEVPSGSPEESSPKNQLEVITSKIEEKTDDEWISWDLLHFLLLLSPYDENEVTWWTMIFEAVRCSLRHCRNTSSHWHHRTVYLPRITRHRRQVSEVPKTTSCPCRNLENYFEKLYDSLMAKNSSVNKL